MIKYSLVWLWQRCSFLILLLSLPLIVGVQSLVLVLILFTYPLASSTIYFISSLLSMLSKQPSWAQDSVLSFSSTQIFTGYKPCQ